MTDVRLTPAGRSLEESLNMLSRGILVFWLLGLAAISSCAPACGESLYRDLLAASDKNKRPGYVLDREEALLDVEVLERIVREGYSGREVLSKEGVDWDGLFQSLRNEVAAQTDWRQKDLLGVFLRHFSVVRDLHFGFVHQNSFHPVHPPERVYFTGIRVRKFGSHPLEIVSAPKGSQKAIGMQLVGMDGEASRDSLFETVPQQPGAEEYLLGKWWRDSEPVAVAIEARTAEGATIEWTQQLSPSTVRWSGGDPRPFRLTYIPFPRIEIRTFSALAGPNLQPFLESTARLADSDAALVDLRGNGGGSDRYAREWLRDVLGSGLTGWSVSELVSPVTLQGDVLLHRQLLARSRTQSEREEAGGRLAHAVLELEKAESEGRGAGWVHHGEVRTEKPAAPVGFQGRLILLVDANTASSAETFVLMAKRDSRTIVVGENTRGMARFGEIKLYSLPHSGIRLQAGSKLFEDPEGGFREGRGIVPDYWLESSDSISEIVGILRGAATGASSSP